MICINWREQLAIRLAPWLVSQVTIHEELQPLADEVYGSGAIWTSRNVLIKQAVQRLRTA